MSAVLAIMAKATIEQVLIAVSSALPVVDRTCIVVAPNDPLVTMGPLIAIHTMKPCVVIEEEWKGHAATRTATLRHAERMADWVVMLDADDTFAPGGQLPCDPSVDSYEIPVDCTFPGGRWRWLRHGHVMRSGCGFTWRGTAGLHEVLDTSGRKTERWDRLVVRVEQRATDSRTRAGERTYDSDAERLGAHLNACPSDARAAFYYAYSLRDAGRPHAAYAAFVARAGMEGFREETLWAKLWAAKLAPYVGVSYDEVILRHQEAIDFAPERAEPLREMAHALRGYSKLAEADPFDALAATKPYPIDARLFVEVNAYSPDALTAVGINP